MTLRDRATYLPDGMPRPVPEPDGLSAPYWEGTRLGELRIQRCRACRAWQWGPEWICHRCHSFDLAWEAVEGRGTIYSWERVWHPVHPALKEAGPYIVVLVELPHAGNVRMLGNLLGDPQQEVRIGAPVTAVFEPHAAAQPAAGHGGPTTKDPQTSSYTLVQWRPA